jgi:hypothetical protein
VAGAGAGLAAWANLAVVCDEAAEQIQLFVLNSYRFVGAELADLRPGEVTAVTAAFAF